jgi:signal transduction histidine kinase
MLINLKTKIWLTICSIVLIFSFFTLLYFPQKQEKLLVDNYNNEVQNLSNTVALGFKIALREQNFEGVQTAIKFVQSDPRFHFVSWLTFDTIWNADKTKFQLQKKVNLTFPEKEHIDTSIITNDSLIVKQSDFVVNNTPGAILLGFNTSKILEEKRKITNASLLVSGLILIIGILIGFLLARNISIPVLALRKAAIKVGEGDLSQKITKFHKDEIGDLSEAFNKMIGDLSKARTELNEKNHTLIDTNQKLNNTLVELKETHAQLIHSEKMASLGELTAGIAHEIQNPLNFVNNFSELNAELIQEMNEEIEKGNMEEVKSIANDVLQNEQKINHHGKRADSIVKGMLQHSRNSTGAKEPTDLNALSDEYLRLAYHGLRAKDKFFNANMKTDFDPAIGKIDVIPQDLGRVILNLITNAFHAVKETTKKGMEGYNPTVTVITKKEGEAVILTVKDNGDGVPQKIIDKIFQPFFTTKPTGQGTGLGLSMSYDIVTKGHGGTINIETKEGEGAAFIVTLPLTK